MKRSLLNLLPLLHSFVTRTSTMSAKAISEASGKTLLRNLGVLKNSRVATVTKSTNYDDLLAANPWLAGPKVRNWRVHVLKCERQWLDLLGRQNCV
jgi:hypothetical protein